MYVTMAFYNSYIKKDFQIGAEILEYLYSRFVLKSPEPNSKASLFYKVVLDLIAKEGDLSTLEAFVEDTTQSQELIAYAYHLLRIKPVMQATVGVIVRGEGNRGYGVGFVVGEDEKYWYLLTNNHVVEFAPWNQQGKNSHSIFLPANDNSVAGIEIPVRLIVATSKGDDLALLKIEKSMIPRSISEAVK